MDYTPNVVSKRCFFFIFKHSWALKRSWKISHGVLESPGFFPVKEWEPWKKSLSLNAICCHTGSQCSLSCVYCTVIQLQWWLSDIAALLWFCFAVLWFQLENHSTKRRLCMKIEYELLVNSCSHLLVRRRVRRAATRRRRTRSVRNSRRVERARLAAVTWLVNCCQRWRNTRRSVSFFNTMLLLLMLTLLCQVVYNSWKSPGICMVLLKICV